MPQMLQVKAALVLKLLVVSPSSMMTGPLMFLKSFGKSLAMRFMTLRKFFDEQFCIISIRHGLYPVQGRLWAIREWE